MTTIAANLEMMVADSKVTDDEGELPSYTAKKIVRFSGGVAGAAGDAGNCLRFMEWAAKDFAKPEPQFTAGAKFVGLILNKEGLHIFDPSYPTAERIHQGKFFAIGSGADAATAALMLGCDPIKAVKLACKIDSANSGLPLQIIRMRPARRKPKSK